jgi:hypothetical protein
MNIGPCLCGDTNCPSCGPAQGADPNFDMVVEWFAEVILADYPAFIDPLALAEDLVDRLGRKCAGPVAELLVAEAARHAQEVLARRRDAYRAPPRPSE